MRLPRLMRCCQVGQPAHPACPCLCLACNVPRMSANKQAYLDGSPGTVDLSFHPPAMMP